MANRMRRSRASRPAAGYAGRAEAAGALQREHSGLLPSTRRRVTFRAGPLHGGSGDPARLLARGSRPCPALPGPKGPVVHAGRLAAHSCGGSYGFGSPTWVLPHRIPTFPFHRTSSVRKDRKITTHSLPKGPASSSETWTAPGSFRSGARSTHSGCGRMPAALAGAACRCTLPAPRPLPDCGKVLRQRAWQAAAQFAIRLPPTRCGCPACFVIPGSSVVEQAAVNRLVAGSNPARGATSSLSSQKSSRRPEDMRRLAISGFLRPNGL